MMTALRFLHFAFYGVKDECNLDSRLTTHNSILIQLPSTVFTDFDALGLLPIVRGPPFDTSTSIVAFEHLRDLDW